jgi:hypothetical protein
MAEAIIKPHRPIYQIAADIRKDWINVDAAAKPYLDAMAHLTNITDSYGADSAEGVVARFLCNASTWRGEVARKIKKELNQIVK